MVREGRNILMIRCGALLGDAIARLVLYQAFPERSIAERAGVLTSD